MKFRVFSVIALCLAIAAALAVFIVGDSDTGDRGTVHVGVLPDQNREALRANYKPLLEYLGSRTGREYKLFIADDYADLVEMFERGDVDLAYFGGLTFVQAQRSVGAQPLVMRETDTRFTTSFVVRNEPEWQGCERLACDALKGAAFSFGSRLSTSGHLMPRHFMKTQAGIVPETHFGSVLYSGAHDRTALDVRSGKAAVGAMNTAILNAMKGDGRLGQDELLVIWETRPYADYVWAVQSTFDSKLRSDVRNAFLNLSEYDESSSQILAGLRASGFVPASRRDFELLGRIATEFELIERR